MLCALSDDPLPPLGGLCTEPPVTEQPKLAVRTALGIKLLDTCELGSKNRQRGVEDLLVKRPCAVRSYQLRREVLKPFGR